MRELGPALGALAVGISSPAVLLVSVVMTAGLAIWGNQLLNEPYAKKNILEPPPEDPVKRRIRLSIQDAIRKKRLTRRVEAYLPESRLSALPGKVVVIYKGRRVALIPLLDEQALMGHN